MTLEQKALIGNLFFHAISIMFLLASEILTPLSGYDYLCYFPLRIITQKYALGALPPPTLFSYIEYNENVCTRTIWRFLESWTSWHDYLLLLFWSTKIIASKFYHFISDCQRNITQNDIGVEKNCAKHPVSSDQRLRFLIWLGSTRGELSLLHWR